MEIDQDFEQAMLQALKEHRPGGLGLVRQLWQTLRSIRSEPHPVEERRTVPRLVCEIPVVMLEGKGARGGQITDVGLFGLSLEEPENLPAGTKIRLLLAHDESLEEVACKVRWCRKIKNGFLCGLKYHQDPISLSRSWVCTLLRELGYDLDHLQQRRHYIRVKTRIPAKMGGMDGQVRDLGVGGALVSADQPLDTDSEVVLSLGPHDELPAMNLLAELRNRRRDDDGAWLHSLHFLDPNEEQTERLGQYVLSFLGEL